MKRCLFVVSIGACALLSAAIAAAQGTKWHPGHYIMLDGLTPVDQHLEQIEELQDDKAITGFMVRLWWHDLETKPGDYDFSLIDAYLKKLKGAKTPKYLVVRIMDRRFNTSDPSHVVPPYLRSDPAYHGGIVRSRTGYVARLWERPIMDRLASLYRAIARRYDSDPLFEGAFTEETTLSLPSSAIPSGYSDELLAQQYKHFIDSVKPTMPNSNLFLNANWIGPDAVMTTLVQDIRDASVGAAGSNVVPGNPTLGQQVVDGVFGADYRQEVPIAYGVESGELGGSLGNFTPAQIGTYAYDVLHANYLFWIRNTWEGSAKQRWDTGILPYLRTKPPVRTRCPNVYGSCGNAAAPVPEAADDAAPDVQAAPAPAAESSAQRTQPASPAPAAPTARKPTPAQDAATEPATSTEAPPPPQPLTPAQAAMPPPAQAAIPPPAAAPPNATPPPAQAAASGQAAASSEAALAQAALAQAAAAQAAVSQAALAQAPAPAPAPAQSLAAPSAQAAATPPVQTGPTGGGGSLGLLDLLALAAFTSAAITRRRRRWSGRANAQPAADVP